MKRLVLLLVYQLFASESVEACASQGTQSHWVKT